MSYKISNTRLDLYRQCGMKYYFRYVLNLEPDKTYTALHFGKALDNALNYLLECKRDNKEINRQEAHNIFILNMKTWQGQNELVYFKNELPKDVQIQEGLEQLAVFDNLLKIGEKMLDTYLEEILPQIEEVRDVQITKYIKNDEGDVLTIVIDFIGKYKGEWVLFDNKTCSDLKNYPSTSVKNSQQLNLYSEFFDDIPKLGYIALQKKIEDGILKWKIVIDDPNEELKEKSFQNLVDALDGIKAGIFNKNEKSCFSFGRLCEYNAVCKYGNKAGLIERKKSDK